MNEPELRNLAAAVRHGRLPRRRFLQIVATWGLTAPMGAQVLMQAGVANAAQRNPYKPAKRGGGGQLRILMWQGPTLLNPHFATGNKDTYGARFFFQSLAEWDTDANLIPVLATEIPSVQNGGLDPAGRWVVWNLKPNVQWHDGVAFTADDVVFNQEYAADPAAAAVTAGPYRDLRVEKLGPHKVRLVFPQPTPFWADAFVGRIGLMIPKHVYDAYRGAKWREAPSNLKPIGVGPYRLVSFVPGDMLRGTLNPTYHEPNRPFFDTVEVKGGGDAVSAARAVLQTGEFDYAWNMQVEDEILKRLEAGGKGRVVLTPTGSIEHMRLNFCDPWTEVEGERGHARSRHPILSERPVREAMSLLVDRRSIQEHIYGRTGTVASSFLNEPARFRSPNMKWEFSVEKAIRALDAAGWKPGADGIRAKGGKKLKFLFQTSTNAPRQKTQAIVKQACGKAGIDLELKSVPASVFFSADTGNPDTNARFSTDLQMFSWTMGTPDPSYFMNAFCSWEIPQKANKWIGRNYNRFQDEEADRLHKATESEMDPVKRAAMFIRINDIAVGSGYVIPIVTRPNVAALGKGLHAQFSSWSSELFLVQDWYRD